MDPRGRLDPQERPDQPGRRAGPQYAPGKTPKVICTAQIRHNQILSVTCVSVGFSYNSRAVVSLNRGKRIVAWGDGRLSHSIALHHRARLHGKYVLTVTVVGGPHTKLKVRL
ncbi:MAG TPA: hypothetical protein VMJ65_30515 [Solirubrobacteraceae bacterium]|nr:hypothetical protein [Solirubrobacteraceae bacterium]